MFLCQLSVCISGATINNYVLFLFYLYFIGLKINIKLAAVYLAAYFRDRRETKQILSNESDCFESSKKHLLGKRAKPVLLGQNSQKKKCLALLKISGVN